MQQHHQVLMQDAAAAVGNGTPFVVAEIGGNAYATLAIQLTGTFSGTVTFEGTLGVSETQTSNTWVAIPAINITSEVGATTATAAGIYRLAVAGLRQVRARISTYTSGNFTATGQGVASAMAPEAL